VVEEGAGEGAPDERRPASLTASDYKKQIRRRGRLIRLAGEYYRIQVRWVKERSVWMAAYAEWRSVGLDDLFPESRDKLREILPK